MSLALGEIAVQFGCEIHGDPDVTVDCVATLAEAGPGSVSFLSNPVYRSQLAATRASAVIIAPDDAADCPTNCLVTGNPYVVYAQVAQLLYPAALPRAGRHPSAVVGADCDIGNGTEIAAGAVLGDRVSVGERCYIGPNCVIGDDVVIGSDSRLFASVSVYHGVAMGRRVRVHSGAVIGADGFGNAADQDGWIKVPQVGSVNIGDDVEIGANTCVDRGAIGDTRLGNDVKLDNQVQIGHNVIIGDHTAMAGQCGIAGSATIGARCLIGGGVAVNGHIEIVDNVSIMGRGNVTKSITTPGVYASVFGVEEAGKWRKIAARVKRLDAMAGRLRALENRLESLRGSDDDT